MRRKQMLIEKLFNPWKRDCWKAKVIEELSIKESNKNTTDQTKIRCQL